MRKMKVYTIDGGGASEIDDAIGVEIFKGDDGNDKQRIWIHIADVDRYVPRTSPLLDLCRSRGTSLYLPTGSVTMFPAAMSGMMSLSPTRDCPALSLGVELNEDGGIKEGSIVVCSSLVRVTYKLTYDDVDDMLAEGVGYNEEWQLGCLLNKAKKRRAYRRERGSTERIIENPVPKGSVTVKADRLCEDGVNLHLCPLEVSYNSSPNSTVAGAGMAEDLVSGSNLMVTEIMILAGEAMGKWAHSKSVPVPYRCQKAPSFSSRSVEHQMLLDLSSSNVGGGLPAAWYARRFFESVYISDVPNPHSGLGLDCYVQWTSPIRRFSDLQVHASIKRHLRVQMVQEILNRNGTIPAQITATDLGVQLCGVEDDIFGDKDPIEFSQGVKGFNVGRKIQRESSR